jgi:hypothetical protein
MLRERAILTYNSPANVVYDLLRTRWDWQPRPARQAVIRGLDAALRGRRSGPAALVLVADAKSSGQLTPGCGARVSS